MVNPGKLAAAPFIFAALLTAVLLTAAGPAPAEEQLEVMKVVLAELEISPEGEQLIQISLRNPTKKEIRAGLKVEIRAGKKKITGIEEQRLVVVPALSERRVFFPMKVPKPPGIYYVRLVIYKPDFKEQLLVGEPEFFAEFKVAGSSADGSGASRTGTLSGAIQGGLQTFDPPEGLEFEKPDLLWENFRVSPLSVLVDEPVKIRAELRNVGGDLARNIEVRLDYFNIRLPNRINEITTSKVAILAPGEKIELEFEHGFPEDTLLGEYHLALVADSANMVNESIESNNRKKTTSPIRLSTIRQIFPEPNFVFDDAGLFLFRWNSNKYNEFKVQVGTEANFENEENFFDIPQGSKWTMDREVIPLEGEMPSMLVGLMMRTNQKVAYWRVVGRQTGTDKMGYSLALPFKISAELEASVIGSEEPETPPGDEAAAGRPSAGAQAPPAGAQPAGGTAAPPPAKPLPGGGELPPE